MRDLFNLLRKDLKMLWPAIIVVLLCFAALDLFFHKVCIFALITGLPCPGCGLSRAFAALVRGDLNGAVSCNAMIFLWIPLVIYLAYCRYIFKKMQAFTPALIIVCLITIAYYLYRMIYVYPSEPVMVYYENNLLSVLL